MNFPMKDRSGSFTIILFFAMLIKIAWKHAITKKGQRHTCLWWSITQIWTEWNCDELLSAIENIKAKVKCTRGKCQESLTSKCFTTDPIEASVTFWTNLECHSSKSFNVLRLNVT